jgi:transcriptional regulator with XRE-family HTH domain
VPQHREKRGALTAAGIVAKRLRQARETSGLSQKELGIKAGMDPFVASPRINQYERDKHIPNPTVLAQLGLVLDVPLPYFYAVEDDLAAAIVAFHRSSTTRRKHALEVLGHHL